jgi:Rad3-related DNA helicase
MPNDVDRRALDLLEHEEQEAARDKERRDHEHHESRIMDARRRIKEDDAEIERERRRRGAEAEAEEISARRHELAEEMEEAAASVNRRLAEYESLHKRHADALRRAGRPLGHDYRLTDVITGWWRARFGGWNSLTGTPSPHFNAEDRPLHERDPLADVTGYDDEEAS